jgi:hypothetical protein
LLRDRVLARDRRFPARGGPARGPGNTFSDISVAAFGLIAALTVTPICWG